MAQIKWINTSGGDFANASNWSAGVPGPGDDALLTTVGTYTVTSNANETVNSLQMISTVTLSITGGTFYAETGSGSGTNAGLISVGNNNTFEAGGTIAGTATITLNSMNNATEFQLNSNVTLSGGGKLILGDNGNNYILANTVEDTLSNVNDTISGSGQFGNGQLSVDNQAAGIINATGTAAALVINTGGGSFTNEGLIEDTGPAGLQINNGTPILNTGTIAAFGAGSHVDLNSNNTTIEGGKLSTSGGGVIQSTNIGTLDGLSHGAITITTGSQIVVDNNTNLYIDGSIVNQGTIALTSINNFTLLGINSGTVTLTGGGAVTMRHVNNVIEATATGAKLVNTNNSISGSGQLGNNSGLAIDNQLGGTINSNLVIGITLDTGGGVFTNEGLVEDTNTGGFNIYNNTAIVNSGTIAAFGAGSVVSLANASLQGGTLTTGSGGVIQSDNYGTLDGATNGAITITANSVVNNTEYLFLDGTIVDGGTIELQSINNSADLWIQSPTVTLIGGGALLMSDNINNFIQSQTAGTKLVNVNNIIVGSGQIGNGNIAIDNQAAGIINSTGTAGLILNTGNYSFTNEGLIKDTSTGGITVYGATNIVNASTISAIGAGSFINIYSGTITGGTLSTKTGGVIQSTNSGTLDGSTTAGAVTITAGSQVAALNNTYLYLKGSFANRGTIGVNSANNATVLWVDTGTVILSGAGSVVLTDNPNNYIEAAANGNKLVNVGNTISGAGQIGNGGDLLIDNQKAATINATGNNNLNINLGGAAFTNEGLVEATGPAGLLIQNATLTNTGTIAALSGSNVNIASTATLTNYSAGTLTGGTYKAVAASGTTSLLGINSIGSITVDAAHLVLSGTGATITAGGTSLVSTLKTITSKGELDIQNGAVYADPSTLSNAGKILLAGSLSATGITNTPTGSITANGGVGVVGTNAKLTNAGLMQATAGGTLEFGKGTVSNTGSIVAQAGGKVILTSAEVNDNLVSGTLTGGTWGAIGAASALNVQDGTITTDAATLTLSGVGSVIASEKTNVALEATLGSIAAGGVLNVLNGRGFASTFAGGINDLGTFAMGGGTFSGGLTIGSGAVFDGTGAISGAVTDNGLLLSSITPVGSTGTLSLTSALHGTGTLEAGASTTLATAGYTIGAVTIDAGGTLTGAGTVSGAVSDAGALVLAGGTLAAGSVTIAAGASLSGFGTVGPAIADSGTITASGGLLLLASASGTGSATIASGATLDSTAALTVAGVGFTGTGETLAFGTPSGNTAVISGFSSGDTIDLLNTVITSFTYNPGNGTLVLKNGTSTLGSLKFAGSYAKTNFNPISDGHGGTDILFVPSAVADLHGAVAATTGGAAAAGLTAAAPAPAVMIPHTAPDVGFSVTTDVGGHAADGLTMHMPATL